MMRIRFVVFMMSCLTAYDAAAKQKLTVLTAYHEEVVAQFEIAFEREHPDIDVKVIWRMTHDALPYLRQPEQGCVDVYWSASLNNFLQLKQEGVWHGGEARLARQHFERLSSDERWHVVRFLESL